MNERNYWTRLSCKRLTRRALLRSSARAGVGAAGLALVGCGDDDDDGQPVAAQVRQQQQQDQPAPAAQQQAQQQQQQQAAEQQAQRAEQQEQPAQQQAQAQAQAQQQAAQQQAQQQSEVAHVPTGEVTWPMVGNISGTEGTTGTGGGDHQVLWTVFDNLVGYNADLAPTASRSLAESWEIPDPLKIIFTLRPNVPFHDGDTLTSESVRLHVERGKNLEGSNVKADLAAIETVVAVDELTTNFDMNAPFSPLLRVLGDRAGMITAPSSHERINETNSREVPVGTGAFTYVDEDLDGPYTQEWFPEYWKPNAPLVEKLTLLQGVAAAQVTNGLLTGEFDLVVSPPTEDLARIEDAGKALSIKPTNGNSFFYINPNLPPWDNPNLRQAVNHAIDRDKLVEVLYDGLHTPNKSGWLGPATGEFHNPDEVLVQYDPNKVREYLELAGYPDGLEYDMNINDSSVAIAQAEFIQASLAQFGINMNIVVRPSPDYYIEWVQKQTAVMMAGMSVRADVWQQMAFVARQDGPFDFALPEADKDAELQAAFTKVTEVFDPEERVVAMRDLNRVLESRAYHIKLYFSSSVMAHDPNLEFEHFGDGKPHFGQADVRWLA